MVWSLQAKWKAAAAERERMREFTEKELNAVRRRLDRMQTELDTAHELARQNANLANTALAEVADLIVKEFDDHNERLAEFFRELNKRLDTAPSGE